MGKENIRKKAMIFASTTKKLHTDSPSSRNIFSRSKNGQQ